MRQQPWAWALLAFFFFGGLGFTIYEGTRWIGIGQIWIAVSVLMALIYLGAFGRIFEKLGSARGEPRTWSPKPGGLAHRMLSSVVGGADRSGAATTEGAIADQSEQLGRLERLRASGDLTDAEYRAERDRIIAAG